MFTFITGLIKVSRTNAHKTEDYTNCSTDLDVRLTGYCL